MRRRQQHVDRLAAVEAVEVAADRLLRLDRVPHCRPMADDAPEYRGTVSGDDVVAEDGIVDVVPFRDLLQGLIHRRNALATTSSETGRGAGFASLPVDDAGARRWGDRRIRKQDAECLACGRGLNFSHR
jgi:hypothetical protein